MEEFARLFGRQKTWSYRRMYSGDLRVIRGLGLLMVPATEVQRLQELAGTATTTSRRRGRANQA